MKTKRFFVVLVSLVLICSFAACDMEFGGLVGELFYQGEGNYISSDDHPISETAVEETAGIETWWDEPVEIETSHLPNDQYVGQPLHVLGSNPSDLGQDEESLSLVSNLSYQRNQTVQQAFGMTVKTVSVPWELLTSEIENQFLSGIDEYELMFAPAQTGVTLAQKGRLHNLYDIPWVDLYTQGWDADMHEGLSIGNYLPMASGVVTPDTILKTSVIYTNKRLAEEEGLAEMFVYVKEGEWTLEKMHAMSEMAYVDLNGDSTVNADADRLGFVGLYDCAQAFACGADVEIVIKDTSTNLPVLNQNTEPIVAAYELFYAMMNTRGVLYEAAGSASDGEEYISESVFTSGRALFYAGNVQTAVDGLEYLEEEYGILPYPKATLKQTSYHSYVDCYASLIMIPGTVRDLDFAAYALEGMHQVSMGLYEDQISMRICRSPEDLEMLNLVFDTKTFDFAGSYLLANRQNSVLLFREAMKSEHSSIASDLRSYQKVWEQELQKMIAQFEG